VVNIVNGIRTMLLSEFLTKHGYDLNVKDERSTSASLGGIAG